MSNFNKCFPCSLEAEEVEVLEDLEEERGLQDSIENIPLMDFSIQRTRNILKMN